MRCLNIVVVCFTVVWCGVGLFDCRALPWWFLLRFCVLLDVAYFSGCLCLSVGSDYVDLRCLQMYLLKVCVLWFWCAWWFVGFILVFDCCGLLLVYLIIGIS